MVYVNGLKYACEACIKGHRSSSCAHIDRPLFEIKKKGRPVTQCEHCRQLRKTKQVHVKCNCEGGNESVRKEPRSRAKRKLPVSPDFPEGISGKRLSPSVDQMNLKSSSLSGCNCKFSRHCSCATPIIKKPDRLHIHEPSPDEYSSPATPPPSVVSSCCGRKASYKSQPLVQADAEIATYPTPLLNDFVDNSPQVIASTSYNTNDMYYGSDPTLPTSFSGSSGLGIGMCSCSALCACPGCFEHSNPTREVSSESCPYACTTCSNCNGFGFAPSIPIQFPPEPLTTSSAAQPFNTWLQSNLFPVLSSLASTSSASASFSNPPSTTPFDRCGGSCQCTAQHLSCECASECCGCCFGCSCSGSGSVGAAAQEEDTRERLGFAVSGERESCCSDPKPHENNRHKTFRAKRAST